MKSKKLLIASLGIVIICAFLFNACQPLKEFGTMPAYQGANNFNYQTPAYDSSKKTVVVIANNNGTELFDMMAPYYLFNATGKANVYIIAKDKSPIVVKKGFYVLPQFTFADFDKHHLKPDVLVIPFLSAADSLHQDPVIVEWIKKHYTSQSIILAVCDGAATAAATGIFDGKPITAHASDMQGIKASFSKPLWTNNIGVVNSGNLYSTAGVSNATDGALMVIDKLFGVPVMNKVAAEIYYPQKSLNTEHKSNTFTFSDKASIGKKILFSKNRKVGVLLQDGINEFDLAAIMDTYNRTFPKSIESFSVNNEPVKTKFGLTIIPTGKFTQSSLDELHVINLTATSATEKHLLNKAKVVKYDDLKNQYLIDICLQRIRADYGSKFERVVKLMLDYN